MATIEKTEGANRTIARQALYDLGFFGHYMHMHAGGRSGKQHMLIKLLAHGGCLSQRDLQERFCISSAALSEVLSKLEAEGFITRTSSDEDRRQREITLTHEGKARAIELTKEREEFERRAFACLSYEELSMLVGLLDRMVDHWGTLEERGRA